MILPKVLDIPAPANADILASCPEWLNIGALENISIACVALRTPEADKPLLRMQGRANPFETSMRQHARSAEALVEQFKQRGWVHYDNTGGFRFRRPDPEDPCVQEAGMTFQPFEKPQADAFRQGLPTDPTADALLVIFLNDPPACLLDANRGKPDPIAALLDLPEAMLFDGIVDLPAPSSTAFLRSCPAWYRSSAPDAALVRCAIARTPDDLKAQFRDEARDNRSVPSIAFHTQHVRFMDQDLVDRGWAFMSGSHFRRQDRTGRNPGCTQDLRIAVLPFEEPLPGEASRPGSQPRDAAADGLIVFTLYPWQCRGPSR